MSKTEQYETVMRTTLEAIKHDLRAAPLEERIELGLILWQTINKARKAIGPVKSDLREHALRIRDGQCSQVCITGHGTARCRVVIPEPTLRLREDADIAQLKTVLGDGFNAIFEERTRYLPRKEALNQRLSLRTGSAAQELLLNSLRQYEPTPRVYLEACEEQGE